MFLIATENPGNSRERRITIPLEPSAPPPPQDTPLYVSESARYRLDLHTGDKEFAQASLFLGSPEDGTCLANAYKDGPMYTPETRLSKSSSDNLFVGLIDILKLTLQLKYADGSSAVYYAPDIFCILENESEEYNVLAIVESLLSFEDDEAQRRLLCRRHHGYNGVTSYKPLTAYIRLFSDLRAAFVRYEPTFRRSTHAAPAAECGVVTARAYSASDFCWLASHPEAFTTAPDGRGLNIGGHCLVPTALPPRSQHREPSQENRLILCFLATIIEAARKLLREGESKVQQSRDFLQNLPPQSNQLHLTIVTIRRAAVERHQAYLDRLSGIANDLESLLRRYRNGRGFLPRPLHALPAPTHAMMSRPEYREFYALMVNWFEQGEFRLSGLELTHDVKDLPQLFEYYCLQRLLQSILRRGFVPTEDGVYTYVYPSPNSSYVREESVANTYRFVRGDTRLTLYYEPVIYGFLPTDRAETTLPNGLTLFRCNSGGTRQSFWAPDFVIKVERRGNVDYAIFDAKYSFTSSILAKNGTSGLLQEIVSKYYLDTATFSGHTTRMVWTLQGRVQAKFHQTQQTDLLRFFTPSHSFGNCPISDNPAVDKLSRLWREMERIIPSLAPS